MNECSLILLLLKTCHDFEIKQLLKDMKIVFTRCVKPSSNSKLKSKNHEEKDEKKNRKTQKFLQIWKQTVNPSTISRIHSK